MFDEQYICRQGPTVYHCDLQVNAKYMALARAMLSYEKQCFSQWQEKVDQTAIQHLKLPILQENADGKKCQHNPTSAHCLKQQQCCSASASIS